MSLSSGQKGNICQLLLGRELGGLSLFRGKAKSIQQKGLESWVESDLLHYCSAEYADFQPAPRSTIAASFSGDGALIASTHGDHSVKVVDCWTGKTIRVLNGHQRTPWVVSIHPTDSDILASGSLDHTVCISRISTGQTIHVHDFDKPIASLAFHPGGGIMVVASGHKTKKSLRAVHFHPGGLNLLLTAEAVGGGVAGAGSSTTAIEMGSATAETGLAADGTPGATTTAIEIGSTTAEAAGVRSTVDQGAASDDCGPTSSQLIVKVSMASSSVASPGQAADSASPAPSQSSLQAAQGASSLASTSQGVITLPALERLSTGGASDQQQGSSSTVVDQPSASESQREVQPRASESQREVQPSASESQCDIQPSASESQREVQPSASQPQFGVQPSASQPQLEAAAAATPLGSSRPLSDWYNGLSTNPRDVLPTVQHDHLRALGLAEASGTFDSATSASGAPASAAQAANWSLESRPSMLGPDTMNLIDRRATARMLLDQQLEPSRAAGPREDAEAAAAVAAAAHQLQQELPCLVHLNLWDYNARAQLEAKAPPLPSKAPHSPSPEMLSNSKLSLPGVVLCSEMGASFSSCGKYIVLCVASNTSSPACAEWHRVRIRRTAAKQAAQHLEALRAQHQQVNCHHQQQHPNINATPSSSTGCPAFGSLAAQHIEALRAQRRVHLAADEAFEQERLQVVATQTSSASSSAPAPVAAITSTTSTTPSTAAADSASPFQHSLPPGLPSGTFPSHMGGLSAACSVGEPSSSSQGWAAPAAPPGWYSSPLDSTEQAGQLYRQSTGYGTPRASAGASRRLAENGSINCPAALEAVLSSLPMDAYSGPLNMSQEHRSLPSGLGGSQGGLPPYLRGTTSTGLGGAGGVLGRSPPPRGSTNSSRGSLGGRSPQVQQLGAGGMEGGSSNGEGTSTYPPPGMMGVFAAYAEAANAALDAMGSNVSADAGGARMNRGPPSNPSVANGGGTGGRGEGSVPTTSPSDPGGMEAVRRAAAEVEAEALFAKWGEDLRCRLEAEEMLKLESVLRKEHLAYISTMAGAAAAVATAGAVEHAGEVAAAAGPEGALAMDAAPPALDITKHLHYELRLYSMDGPSFGQVIAARPIHAAHCITSVQLSPTSDHVLVAYGRRHVGLCSLVVDSGTLVPVHTIIEVYSTKDMSLVRVLPSLTDEVNVACFHPLPGGGLVYGTKEGKLRIFKHNGRAGPSQSSLSFSSGRIDDELASAELEDGQSHSTSEDESPGGSLLQLDMTGQYIRGVASTEERWTNLLRLASSSVPGSYPM
eukprot:gene25993-11683_t